MVAETSGVPVHERVSIVSPVTGPVATLVPLQVGAVSASMKDEKTPGGFERIEHCSPEAATRPLTLQLAVSALPLRTLGVPTLKEIAGGMSVHTPPRIW